MTSAAWLAMRAPKIAAVVLLSLPAGAVLAGMARRFAGASSVSSLWMVAGSLGIGVCALSASPSLWEQSSSVASWAGLALDLSLGCSLLLLAAIDIAVLRLPDLITLPLCLAGLALGGAGSAPLSDRFIGAVLGAGAIAALNIAYVRLRGRTGIGLGDAKLFGVAGAWLGWRALPTVLLLACGGGLAWIALRVLARGRATAGAPFPFGAPLCLAIWITWLLPG